MLDVRWRSLTSSLQLLLLLVSFIVVPLCHVSPCLADCTWYADCGQCAGDVRCSWCSIAGSLVLGACLNRPANHSSLGRPEIPTGLCSDIEYTESCPLADSIQLELASIMPNRYAMYAVTPFHSESSVRVVVRSRSPDDDVDIFGKIGSRVYSFNRDYQSVNPLNPWSFRVPALDNQCFGPRNCSRVFVSVMGNNMFPSVAGSSEYSIIAIQEFDFRDFSCPDGNGNCSFSNLLFIGSATVLRPSSEDSVKKPFIRLVPSRRDQVGGVWYTQSKRLIDSFDVRFSFRIHNQSDCDPRFGRNCHGGDGFAFILHGASSPDLLKDTITTGSGASMGIFCTNPDVECMNGLPKSLAIEFDTWHSDHLTDPRMGDLYIRENGTMFDSFRSNHIAVFSAGSKSNGNHHFLSPPHRGSSLVIPNLSDGLVHNVMIQYHKTTARMDIYIDDFDIPSLSSEVIFRVDEEELTGGRAFLGFVASTGYEYQSVDILSWKFCSELECAVH